MEQGFRTIISTHPILVVIQRYLSTGDLFRLTATCRYMHDSWVRRRDCIDVLDMRARIEQCLKYKYKSNNPFIFIRKSTQMPNK